MRLANDGGFNGRGARRGVRNEASALHVAALGLPVLGIDVAETAVALARGKATVAPWVDAGSRSSDALRLDDLARAFETVLDCGLFHTFDGDERRAYVAGLASVDAVTAATCTCSASATAGPAPDPLPSARRRAPERPSAADQPGSMSSPSARSESTRGSHEQGVSAWLATVERI